MRVLFLGEGSLHGPARYLAAILTWMGARFDHRPDQHPLPATWMRRRYDAMVLSDYRAASFNAAARRWWVRSVHDGAGFLMIGGWASFTGSVGQYGGTDIEALLPVRCIRGDDRVNWASGSVLKPVGRGASFFPGVSWAHPPVVCGYHRAHPRAGTQTLLKFQDLRFEKGRPSLGRSHPALVMGQARAGRTAAFLTDCAPHWAGGLVDWGKTRRSVVVGDSRVEIGLDYLNFFAALLRAVAR